MEEKSASIWKSTLISGLYLAIVLILISVIFYVMGKPFSKAAQYLTYPVIIAGIVMAQINHKKAQNGFLSYGQAIGVGVLAMVFAAVFSGIYTVVLYTVIDPSLQEQLRIYTEQQIIQQGKVPEEQIEMAVNMTSKFQSPPMLFVMGLIMGALSGLIVSLITGIFIKKKPADEVPV